MSVIKSGYSVSDAFAVEDVVAKVLHSSSKVLHSSTPHVSRVNTEVNFITGA